MPFNMVLESSLEVKKVIIMLNITTEVKIKVEIKELQKEFATKNMVIMEISSGNLPLQGIKLFVISAINLSRGESIILHPITPQALHPRPMHMVRACLPCAPHFLKILSKLKATLGKYPTSSKKVNRGKNIAIGGSITETTQAKVLYIPKIKIP